MTAHVTIPVLRVHAPYIERKNIRLEIRMGLLAALLALLVCGGIALVWTLRTVAAEQTRAVVVRFLDHKVVPRGMQYPRPTPSYDDIYAPGAQTWNVQPMYAKPKPRHFDR